MNHLDREDEEEDTKKVVKPTNGRSVLLIVCR